MSELLLNMIKEGTRPFLVAGPCSAETEAQLHSVAKDLKESGWTNILRAGIWKPRTRPDSFEGLGEKALPWLVESGKSNGLLTATEVANAKHVELALEAGVDILWIGARTTVNPFTVQEIADALKGTDTSIMVKNPVNPDLKLWLGAIERFENVGLKDIVAIHRGFSTYNHPKYRNIPNWEIPIALKEYRPETPVICDPSHITGKRDLLLEVSQKAMDLNFDGLMIETHPTPDSALSDSAQQITPDGLNELMSRIILRTENVSRNVADQIEDIRTKVMELDDRLFDILSERMQFSEEVGKLKQENNITILQQAHWTKLINSRLDQAGEYGLTPKFVRQLMDAIHQESIRHQTKIMNPKK